MPSVRLRPENVTSAPSRTATGPKPVPCSVPSTSRDVTSAKPEQSPAPRPCLALFPFTTLERHVGPSRTVTCPKTMSCSVPVYVPRPSRRLKPNSRRSQDHVVLCSCLRPKNVTSAQAEPSPVPRPCRALFLSTSQDRHVGPSRTVTCPKTVSSLFLSTSQDRHVGPSRTGVCAGAVMGARAGADAGGAARAGTGVGNGQEPKSGTGQSRSRSQGCGRSRGRDRNQGLGTG